MYQKILKLLQKHPNISLISFDIFDTLVTRVVNKPEDVFFILEKELIEKKLITSEVSFYNLRISAHKKAYQGLKNGHEEITLDAVYLILQDMLKIDTAKAELIKQMELDLELSTTISIAEMIQIIKICRIHQKKILFTSDMYLPMSYIETLLSNLNIFEDGDKIYLSNHINKRKSTGNLFNHILENESVHAINLLHIGDTLKSDIVIPKKLGIKTLRYDKIIKNKESSAQLNPYEGYLHKVSTMTSINLLFEEKIIDKKNLINFSSFVAAPLLYFYTLWILETAKKYNFKKLYFLSRDGEILYKIAKIIIEKQPNYSIELHYLFASRQMWHLPSIGSDIGDEEFSWIFQNFKNKSINSILKKLDINFIEISGIAKKFNIKNNQIMKTNNLETVKKLILDNAVKELIISRAKTRRDLLIRYFKQEKLLSEKDICIVDLGWHGNLQRSLRKILDIEKYANFTIHGFYYKLIEDHTYPKDKTYPYEQKFLYNATVPILEIFAYATHNSATSLRDEHNYIVPILSNGNTDILNTWGIEYWHKSIEKFSLLMSSHDLKYLNTKKLSLISIDTFNSFYISPKKKFLELLSIFPYEYDQSGKSKEYIVQKLNFSHLLTLLKIKTTTLLPRWFTGSYYYSNYFYKIILYPFTLIKKL